ncbi:DUF308 domain-containing protein [uncultured Schumannella sp.]|uniref:DUF308 domain-containing protein n=1 Tax=uncultured Schumannella sp. TaxID=1195956 RepID=UPI0025E79750|nr:DUF308 domain-containing protein [uncultured Schumannella sp.]
MSSLSPASAITPLRARVDLPLLGRGLVAVALGLVITFSPDHSAGFGLIAFGAYAVAAAAIQLAALRGRRPDRHDGRGLTVVQAVATLVAGIAALAIPVAAPAVFVAIVSAWALLVGGVDLTLAVRVRRSGGSARDAVVLGVLALALALAVLVVPPDYLQPWEVADRTGAIEASGAVTASIMVVGLLGAWAVIQGLLLVISAIPAARAEAETTEES